MIFFVIMLLLILLILFTVIISIKLKCPNCDGILNDIDMCDEHIVYKCRNCGEELI